MGWFGFSWVMVRLRLCWVGWVEFGLGLGWVHIWLSWLCIGLGLGLGLVLGLVFVCI